MAMAMRAGREKEGLDLSGLSENDQKLVNELAARIEAINRASGKEKKELVVDAIKLVRDALKKDGGIEDKNLKRACRGFLEYVDENASKAGSMAYLLMFDRNVEVLAGKLQALTKEAQDISKHRNQMKEFEKQNIIE